MNQKTNEIYQSRFVGRFNLSLLFAKIMFNTVIKIIYSHSYRCITVNLSLAFIYPLLGLSLIVGLSSTNSLTLWMILEVNTILFISIVYLIPGSKKTSALVKYFTIQSLRSLLFIFTRVSRAVLSRFGLTITILALILKLGIVPLHLWYLSILQDLNWIRIFILSTVQKLLPLFFISSLINAYEAILVALVSRVAGIWALGVSSLKRLVGYSSLLNIGWMLLSTLSASVFIQFFITYFFRILGLINYLSYFISEKIRDLKKFNSLNDTVTICLLILRLRAFPPLLGFWAKLFILKLIIEFSLLLAIFLLVNTVFLIYTYITLVDFLFTAIKRDSIRALKAISNGGNPLVFLLLIFGGVFLF